MFLYLALGVSLGLFAFLVFDALKETRDKHAAAALRNYAQREKARQNLVHWHEPRNEPEFWTRYELDDAKGYEA